MPDENDRKDGYPGDPEQLQDDRIETEYGTSFEPPPTDPETGLPEDYPELEPSPRDSVLELIFGPQGHEDASDTWREYWQARRPQWNLGDGGEDLTPEVARARARMSAVEAEQQQSRWDRFFADRARRRAAPIHHDGDEWRPANLRPDKVVKIQRDLVRAGLLAAGFKRGVWDRPSADAYRAVLHFGNGAGLPADRALTRLVSLSTHTPAGDGEAA